jgi:hypothetical protein
LKVTGFAAPAGQNEDVFVAARGESDVPIAFSGSDIGFLVIAFKVLKRKLYRICRDLKTLGVM